MDSVAAADDSGAVLHYGELWKLIADLTSVIPPRSIVFVLCTNTVGSLCAYLASYANRAVPLLIGSSTSPELLARLIETYTPSYLWAQTGHAADFTGEAVYTQNGYTLYGTGAAGYPVDENLSFLLSTSGTTGSPKLVRHKYGNLEANAENVAAVFGWGEQERGILNLPMQYTMGLNVINSHLHAGASVLLTEHNLMSPAFWARVKTEKATNFTGVPFSYEVLFKLRFTRMALPDLTTLAEGGGRLPDQLFAELAEYAHRTGKRFFATFGTTETSARLAYLKPEFAREKTGSIGSAIPGGELFLIDEEGRVLAETEAEGELVYRGPNVTMGYAQCREDLQKGDEWHSEYRTGDLARRDAEGCYYIIGRKGRFLKLYGLRVSLDECERMIQSAFPDMDCACVGDDDHLLICLTETTKGETVCDFLSDKIGLPRKSIQSLSVERIPRNAAGKVEYRILECVR